MTISYQIQTKPLKEPQKKLRKILFKKLRKKAHSTQSSDSKPRLAQAPVEEKLGESLVN